MAMAAPITTRRVRGQRSLDLQIARGGPVNQEHRERDQEEQKFDEDALGHALIVRRTFHRRHRAGRRGLQHPGGSPPDVASVVGHGVVGAQGPPEFTFVSLMIGRVHQEADSGVSNTSATSRVWGTGTKSGGQDANEGRNRESAAGKVGIALPQHADGGGVDADLLVGFAQRPPAAAFRPASRRPAGERPPARHALDHGFGAEG
jgi:hypothetical protein